MHSSRTLNTNLLAFIGGMVVWALWGEKLKNKISSNATFAEMKAKVMDKAKSTAQMTEEKYHKIVDEVSESYSKAKGISQNELQDMVSDLKVHWSRIKDKWNQPVHPASSASSDINH